MYFKCSLRHNPATGKAEGYYRLVESYRNASERVCHKTLLNVGFIDQLVDIDQLNQVRRILCNRYEEALGQPKLFEIELDNAPTTAQNKYEEVIFSRRCSEPNAKVQAIYEKLKYKQQPFIKRKFVVHKSELQKMEYLIYLGVMT